MNQSHTYQRLTRTIVVILASFLVVVDGAAQFSQPVLYGASLSGSVRSHWIGDFNGDGKADVLSMAAGGSFFLSVSNGRTLNPETKMAASLFPDGLRFFVGDVDGDGHCDLVAYEESAHTWTVATTVQVHVHPDPKINGTYIFNAPQRWGSDKAPGSLGQWIGDFNGDGLADRLSRTAGGTWFVALSNGGKFTDETQWGTAMLADADRWMVGDFNGDGASDLAGYSSSAGEWKVALSEDSGGSRHFAQPVRWSTGAGDAASTFLAGDVNADGPADRIRIAANGTTAIALSHATGFDIEMPYATPAVAAMGGIAAADVNGDGYCDLVGFTENGTCMASLTTVTKQPTVAVWYTTWYTAADTSSPGNFWNHSIRDGQKTPVTGVGADARTGVYSSNDPAIIRRHIQEMRESGIDLIIVDFTNGYYRDYDAHTARIRAAADSLFRIMSSLPAREQLKIAVAVGIEFWGPAHSPMAWPGWPKMKERQKISFDRILREYAMRYPSLYFRYRGRPLVPIYITDGTDVPLKETTGVAVPIWHDNRVTIKNLVGWDATWSYIQKDNGFFHNGLDNNYNGWCSGSLYGGSTSAPALPVNIPELHKTDPPLPYSAECMGIMPGTHNYINKAVSWNIARSSPTDESTPGEYYIKSWKEIIKDKPLMATITDWNNWNEETAIEPSTGWKDYYGEQQPDWYLQITAAGAAIYKTGKLPEAVYVKEENAKKFYLVSGGALVPQQELPHHKPVVMVPSGWFTSHGVRIQTTNTDEFPRIR